MTKNTFFFSHDYNARIDSKIRELLFKFGMEGYGIFWAIVEDLYNNTNVLETKYERIAYDLRTNTETVKSIVNDFGLFVVNGETFSSNSIQNRLDERNNKSVKAKLSIQNRWGKYERNTNVSENEYERNTIKERKVKENKGNEIKENIVSSENSLPTTKRSFEDRRKEFIETLKPFSDKYGKDTLNAFYIYWSEPNTRKTKMRWELEKTWDIAGRLVTWLQREPQFVRKQQNQNAPQVNEALERALKVNQAV